MPRRPRIAFLVVQLEFDGTYPDLLVRSALASAERHGCDLLVVPGREWGARYEREGILTAVYRLLPLWPLDAVILSPPVTNHWAEPDLLRGMAWLAPLPVVTIAVPVGSAPRVELDAGRGVGEAVRHLITVHGRRRIACLRGPRTHAAAEVRYQAWRQVLLENGLDASDDLVAEVEFKEEGVAQALGTLLDRAGPLDAVAAASDLVALAAVRELRRRGLRVPEDVSVVGYDDLPLGAVSSPPLTSVNQALGDQVDAAFALALVLIQGRPPGPAPTIRTRLVVRQSCGCPPDPDRGPEVPAPTMELQRRLERLATFHLGLGHRHHEEEFHDWLRDQFPHQGFPQAVLALGHHAPATDPSQDLPEPPTAWTYPLGRTLDDLWGPQRRTLTALPLASDRLWFGMLFLDLEADGALVYRGIQEGLTRHYREQWERQILISRSVEEETAKRVEQEKMRALGTLVAGVAHEVNTPLGTAITAASFLENELKRWQDGTVPDFAPILEGFSLLRANLDRAADLITRFKRVSVERTLDSVEDLDLSLFLSDLLPSLAFPLRRSAVDITVAVDPGLRIATVPAALFDIFVNLTQNVLDHAYPQGGPGTVRLQAVSGPGGQGAVLTFSDRGLGMDDTVRRRIFDPFFTTRRGNGGTGLGLHLVYNLVHQRLGGRIVCESVPGQGTLFRIDLPSAIDTTSEMG